METRFYPDLFPSTTSPFGPAPAAGVKRKEINESGHEIGLERFDEAVGSLPVHGEKGRFAAFEAAPFTQKELLELRRQFEMRQLRRDALANNGDLETELKRAANTLLADLPTLFALKRNMIDLGDGVILYLRYHGYRDMLKPSSAVFAKDLRDPIKALARRSLRSRNRSQGPIRRLQSLSEDEETF